MTLQEATNFFESLKTETTDKSEIKLYERFLHILTELKSRELSKDEIQSIETELESLKLKTNPDNRKKYLKKALRNFEKYLKDTFSLTSKGHYTNIGIGLGSSFGIQDRFASFNLSVAGYMIKPVDYPQFVEVLRAINVYWRLSELS